MWKRGARPLVIGHRGASRRVTENTMAAFRAALEEGADGVELDVHQCKTGEVVVHHDFDLLRLGGTKKTLAELSLAELREVRLLDGHVIPTLAEVFEELPEQALINVELKSKGASFAQPLARAVAALLRARRRPGVLCSSFDPTALFAHRLFCPEAPRALLFHSEQSLPLRRGLARAWVAAGAVHPEAVLVTAARMAKWRAQGRSVNVWTGDEPEEVARLARLGVDALITNTPAAVLASLSLPQ